jgi:MFS family permease
VKKSLFKNIVFVKMYFSSTVSFLADRMVMFVVPLWIMSITASSTKVALINALITITTVLITPLTGTLADRVSRRKLMIIADLLRMIIMATLGWLTFYNIFLFEFVVIFLLLRTVGSSLFSPASNAALVTFVDKEHINSAIALRQTMNQLVSVGAPLLGGILLVWIRFEGVFWMDAVAFLISVSILLTLKFPRELELKKKKPFWSDFKEGMKMMFKSKTIRSLIISAGIINVLGAALTVTLQVFVVRAEFSPMWWSIIFASSPVGIILGAVLARTLKVSLKTLSNSFFFTMIMGIFNTMMGFVHNPLFFSVLFLLSGLAFGISNVNFGVLYRELIAPEQQGRFFGFLNSLLLISVPLGQMFVGLILEITNAQVIIQLLGMLTAVSALLFWVYLRRQKPSFEKLNV